MLGSLYSEAVHFATKMGQNFSKPNPLVAVSEKFQNSVSAMFPAISARQNHSITLSDLKVLEFITNIRIYVKNTEELRTLIDSDLCKPIFSHLLSLTLVFGFPFHNGNEIAAFIHRFRLLESLQILSDPNFSILPEVFIFFNDLFKSSVKTTASSNNTAGSSLTYIINAPVRNTARFVVYVRSFYLFLSSHGFSEPTSPQASDFRALMDHHQVRLFLARKMVEVYRKEGKKHKGESIVIFVGALSNSLCSLINDRSVDPHALLAELKPCLDCVEPIIRNNDLFKDCYIPSHYIDCFNKFDLAKATINLFSIITKISRECTLEFMKQYGRRLIPAFFDTLFSNYDRSQDALRVVSLAIDSLSLVVPDYLWNDELTFSSDIGDFKKIAKNGYKFLQHIPFDKCAISIEFFKVASEFQRDAQTVNLISRSFWHLLNSIRVYCTSLHQLGDVNFEEMILGDVAARMNKTQILQGLFSFIKNLLKRNPTSKKLESQISIYLCNFTNYLKEMLCVRTATGQDITTTGFTGLNARSLFGDDSGVKIDEAIGILKSMCKKFEKEMNVLSGLVVEFTANKSGVDNMMMNTYSALNETSNFVTDWMYVVRAAGWCLEDSMASSKNKYWTLEGKLLTLESALSNGNRLNIAYSRGYAEFIMQLTD